MLESRSSAAGSIAARSAGGPTVASPLSGPLCRRARTSGSRRPGPSRRSRPAHADLEGVGRTVLGFNSLVKPTNSPMAAGPRSRMTLVAAIGSSSCTWTEAEGRQADGTPGVTPKSAHGGPSLPAPRRSGATPPPGQHADPQHKHHRPSGMSGHTGTPAPPSPVNTERAPSPPGWGRQVASQSARPGRRPPRQRTAPG